MFGDGHWDPPKLSWLTAPGRSERGRHEAGGSNTQTVLVRLEVCRRRGELQLVQREVSYTGGSEGTSEREALHYAAGGLLGDHKPVSMVPQHICDEAHGS